MDPSTSLDHKIKKYRHKSTIDSRHEDRLMHYIAQNRFMTCDCGDPLDNSALKVSGQNGGAATRKGPEQSATLYKTGTKKTGNDGNKWIITETADGVKRWKLYKKVIDGTKSKSKTKSKSDSKAAKINKKIEGIMEAIHSKHNVKAKLKSLGKTTESFIPKTKLTGKDREYLIHDNGGRPFKVVANNKGIDVYVYKDDPDRDWEEELVYDIHLLSFKTFIGYWVGFDTSQYTNFHGNSILIQETEHSYVSIGWAINRFNTTDTILDYVSPVGNSDVPYPVAYGTDNVYFMLEMQYVPREQLQTNPTPANAEKVYCEFYEHPQSDRRFKITRMKNVKVLAKRRW